MTGALTKKEFDILETLYREGMPFDDAGYNNAGAFCGEVQTSAITNQRELAMATGMSLGTANALYRSLVNRGLIRDFDLTDAGRAALEPYRVKNAIIMAAGLSTRFAPISYEKPKGVLRVRGEVLIERQIRQLQEAGIATIYVVVGYMKEEFFYLEDKFGVTIVVNEEYAQRNNNSTIYCVRHWLGNSYICSSDDYFTQNPFRTFVFESYYAAVYAQGPTSEWCMTTKGADRRITGVEVGGHDAWIMFGQAYWNTEFSQRFIEILEEEYNDPSTAPKLWEDIYVEHIRELAMVMRPYDKSVIWEFDSLDELRAFDPQFIDNVDSSIMDNIAHTLHCKRSDICAIEPLKQGLSNLSFCFTVYHQRYVYRHPGSGAHIAIHRDCEANVELAVAELGLDKTFMYENPQEGWKLSHYVEDCVPFDYKNSMHMEIALTMLRKLHCSDTQVDQNFDIFEETKRLINTLDAGRRTSFPDFIAMYQLVTEVEATRQRACGRSVLCHNNLTPSNVLVKPAPVEQNTQNIALGKAQKNRAPRTFSYPLTIDFIDWEYAAMGDYAIDLAIFFCNSTFNYTEIIRALHLYFERELTQAELIHLMASLCVANFYWFIWSLFEETQGRPVGQQQFRWYKATKFYGSEVRRLATASSGIF